MRDLILLAFIAASLLLAVRYPFTGVLLWAWFTLATPQAAVYWANGFSLNTVIAGLTFLTLAAHGEFWRA